MHDDYDCHGVAMTGRDEGNLWAGTPNAWMVLGDEDTSGAEGWEDGPPRAPATPTYFEASGAWENLDFQGYFLASNEANVRRYLDTLGVRDVIILAMSLSRRVAVYMACGFFFVTDEESRRLTHG